MILDFTVPSREYHNHRPSWTCVGDSRENWKWLDGWHAISQLRRMNTYYLMVLWYAHEIETSSLFRCRVNHGRATQSVHKRHRFSSAPAAAGAGEKLCPLQVELASWRSVFLSGSKSRIQLGILKKLNQSQRLKTVTYTHASVPHLPFIFISCFRCANKEYVNLLVHVPLLFTVPVALSTRRITPTWRC